MTKKISTLLFDVFGTVVDWRTSINIEIEKMASKYGRHFNWNEFSISWRAGYQPAMDKVRKGKLPWQNIDQLHRMILDELIIKYDLSMMAEEDKIFLNKAWHRLRPWEDSVNGLKMLKENFTIGTLSNGNVSLLVNMAKNSGLPWDCVLSAEIFRHYKPDPEVYKGAAKLLGQPVRELSLGERMKMELIAALLHSPEVLFLDEPTIGLDVVAQHNIQNFLRYYQKLKKITILLTSHYMKDVVALCKRVVIVTDGVIVHDGSLEDIIDRFSTHKVITLQFADNGLPIDISHFGEIIEEQAPRIKIRVAKQTVTDSLAAILQQHPVEDVSVEDPPLEQVIAEMFASVSQEFKRPKAEATSKS